MASARKSIVNSIDQDGTRSGYDLAVIKAVSVAVPVPVIACGGAGSMDHLVAAVEEGGASAVACRESSSSILANTRLSL